MKTAIDVCPKCDIPFKRRVKRCCPHCKTYLVKPGEFFWCCDQGFFWHGERGWRPIEDVKRDIETGKIKLNKR